MSKQYEIQGMIFGNWYVVERSKTNSKHNAKRWVCRCICGAIRLRPTGQIVSGHSKSCGKKGCLVRSKISSGEQAGRKRVIQHYRQNSKNYNHVFCLSEKQLDKLFKGKCFYCGCNPKNTIGSQYKFNDKTVFTYNGIDRKDAKKGYVIGNVVSCCSDCNYAKQSLTVNQFIQLVEKIYEHRIRRKCK
jgi:hypothetical protein